MTDLPLKPHIEPFEYRLGAPKDFIDALKLGDTSIQFRELSIGVFRALDSIEKEGHIDQDQCSLMKIELYQAMLWLTNKLNEIERDIT